MTDTRDEQSWFSFLTVVIGMAVLLLMFSLALYVFKDASNPAEAIVSVLGAVTGVLGTLVGYVAGQAGKEKAEQRATKTERQLTAVVGEGGKDILRQAKNAYPELFK